MLKFIKKQIANMTKNWEENRMLSEGNDIKTPQEPPSPEVSEPVISFVQCVKDNPKRFLVELESYHFNTKFYRLTDLVTKQSWKLSRFYYIGIYENTETLTCNDATWLSENELKYIYEEVRCIKTSRRERLKELKLFRHERTMSKERERLMEVYCK